MSQEWQCEFFRLTYEPGYAGNCSAFDRLGAERVKLDLGAYKRFCKCDSERCGYHFFGKFKQFEDWIKD